MADQNMPNDASRKSKAEGERWSPESENAGADERSGYRSTNDDAAGITNRSLDEEMSNQESLPKRGESRPGAHAGHGDGDSERSER
jgi:hypothetical protein